MKEKINKIILSLSIILMTFFINLSNVFAINICASTKITCDEGLSDLISEYWSYVMLATPILLIIMITLDFFKALFSSDADLIKKASDNAVKRVLAAVLLLCLPLVIETILGFFGLELCL